MIVVASAMNEGNEWVNSDAFIPYDDRGRGQINSGMGGYPRYGNQYFFNVCVIPCFYCISCKVNVSEALSLSKIPLLLGPRGNGC